MLGRLLLKSALVHLHALFFLSAFHLVAEVAADEYSFLALSFFCHDKLRGTLKCQAEREPELGCRES